jgi:hypothetical protein
MSFISATCNTLIFVLLSRTASTSKCGLQPRQQGPVLLLKGFKYPMHRLLQHKYG